jgi:N6-L-threonylcarbamoyladenine synthase
MRILGIESTCDETGASVVEDGRIVRSNIVATQIELHAKYRGVVPEIASRAHIENILPVLRESIATAACGLADIDAIAVAHRPGLIGSLLIGVTAAKSLAWSLGKPLIGVDHVHAHLYSVMLGEEEAQRHKGAEARSGNERERHSSEANLSTLSPSLPAPHSVPSCLNASVPFPAVPFPAIGLVCSGGHTALYHLRSWLDVQLIGSTIDDAVGEAYDKVAALLGLGYPGGPILDRLAQKGDPKAIQFPRSLMARDSLDFSFSGLKTAVLYNVHGVPTKDRKPPSTPPQFSDQRLADIAASFQAACIDVLIRKIKRAIHQTGAKSVIIGGGVSANAGLRTALKNFPLPVHFPVLTYCTDNAAMSAGLAHLYLSANRTSPLDLDAIPYSQFLTA